MLEPARCHVCHALRGAARNWRRDPSQLRERPRPGTEPHGQAPIVDGTMDLWVLFHPAIQHEARVWALSEFIAETPLAARDLFEERRPGAKSV